MINNDHKIRYHFRAIYVPLHKVREYQKLMPNVKIRHQKWSHGRGQVMLIELTSKKVCTLLRNTLKTYPLSGEFGLWVDLITTYDHDGLRVPRYVSDFHHEVGGRIDFFFTCLAARSDSTKQSE